MDTAKIKSYAPKARKAFIEAITRQAALLGITEQNISPVEIKGDIALIDGKPHPASISQRRSGLERQIKQQGYQQVIERIAYSWFNRFVALRYMELHNYLDHGRRVLSHPKQDNAFQILEECTDIDMEGLDKNKVIQLKLAGDKDEELYRLLLLAQCHQLHNAMGFLFEAVDDASELLLPNNLTKTDSLIRQLVSDIPEALWQNVEIIGWLYQFYISEKKDEVMGKVVKSEDIPAATQLFTPNWIVKYLVQNSIGRQWMMTYPGSPLKGQMEYYIEPVEQTDEVQAKLKEITPDSIDPETIKVLDPACGSGHILVEAYDLLKAIYTERGYRSRDIPKLILENNLFGLDIDDRAAQLAGFALLMKARADDKRIFTRNIDLNVLALQSSQHINPIQLWNDLNLHSQWQKQQTEEMFVEEQKELSTPENDADYQLIVALIELFQQSKTFGSLIDVPHSQQVEINTLFGKLRELSQTGDTRQKPAVLMLLPILHQAMVLSQRYNTVVANPPYMGSKALNKELKDFAKINYPNSKSDLFTVFIERCLQFTICNGHTAMIVLPSWLFLSSFEKLRKSIVVDNAIDSLLHMGRGIFGIDWGSTAFVINKDSKVEKAGSFFRLHKRNFQHLYYEDIAQIFLNSLKSKEYKFNFDNYRGDSGVNSISSVADDNGELVYFSAKRSDFGKIPGSPIAYWLTKKIFDIFETSIPASKVASSRAGMTSGDNDRFTRQWYEVNFSTIKVDSENWEAAISSSCKWFPYNKGGSYRKWFGNITLVVNYDSKSRNILKNTGNNCASEDCYFKEGVTWSDITSGRLGARYMQAGTIFDIAGHCAFPVIEEGHLLSLGMLNTSFINDMSKVINATMHFQPGDFKKLPFPIRIDKEDIKKIVNACVSKAETDWNIFEVSCAFNKNILVRHSVTGCQSTLLKSVYEVCQNHNHKTIAEMKHLEEENNRLFIDAYSIQDEFFSEIPIEQITLTVNPKYRYGSKGTSEELDLRFQSDTLSELISYSIGCMMGRYSLDREGLIYAHAANEGFAELVAEGAYKTFPADDDGIIPLTDQEWFDDDATNRFRDFVKTVWGEEQLRENLAFVAESLCLHAIKPKRGEASIETIRRYLATKFYKDHLKTYKKRPIYWLFSSGKQKAFECLVYLHRYNAGTLARMRTEYVIPLTSKLNSHVEKLEQDKESSESAAEVKTIEKELQALHKKQAELSTFDEKLRHFADQGIELDLDDGVKVNYGKFGDLLADVKAITGIK